MGDVRVQIEGLAGFRHALKAAADATPRELSKALRPAAAKVADRAAGYTTGRVAAAVRPFARGATAGIRSDFPGARVHEFATTYQRRNRSGSGTHTVRWGTAKSTPPRYAYRAADELIDGIGDDLLDAVAKVAKAHGWL